MSLGLTGVAFVTGAASGIGEQVAIGFAREGVRSIALCDINLDNLKKVEDVVKRAASNQDFKSITILCNVAKSEECENAVQKATEAFGRIDYAVNCAGITRPKCNLEEQSEQDVMDIISINQAGVFWCMKAQIKQMLKQTPDQERSMNTGTIPGNRGSIVNIASICGLLGIKGSAAYVGTKHAVIGLTKNAAVDQGNSGIRINCVCPGYIKTAMTSQIDPGVMSTMAVDRTPLARAGLPEEVAATILFQSSPRASYVQGAVWAVDGGFSSSK